MKTKTTSITYKELDKETAEKLDIMFQKKNSMIEVNPSKAILPTAFRLIGEDILNLPIHESDVWLCSYPRTGIYYFIINPNMICMHNFNIILLIF